MAGSGSSRGTRPLQPMVFDAHRVRIQGTVVGVLRRYDRRG